VGFSPPVVTILAKGPEKITRENEFEPYGKWFSIILRCSLCSLTHNPNAPILSLSKSEILSLITFSYHSPGSSSPEVMRSTVIGARLRVTTSGGGGFGDPLEREPVSVLADFLAGKITPEHARSVYGVVLTGTSVDIEATGTLRTQMGGKRDG
jgi:hypothetical protein